MSRGEASAEDPSIIRNGYMADASPLQDQGQRAADTPQQARIKGTMPGSLGAIIQNFKSVSTRQLHKIGILRGKPVWLRNYFEHIIRSEAEWERICQYIDANPDRWAEDEENRQRSA